VHQAEQVVAQHETEQRQGQAPRREQLGHRGMQQVLVDVIERHQQQREPLQRFQRAAAHSSSAGALLVARIAPRLIGIRYAPNNVAPNSAHFGAHAEILS
jgi:hypothetical protein